MAHNGISSLGCRAVQPLTGDETAQLSDSVLFRIVRGDEKGRPFGTPRNPREPTMDEFNPLIGELNASEIAGKIGGRKHGLFSEQTARISQLSNEDLIRFRPEDPISAHAGDGTFSITGGHHRL